MQLRISSRAFASVFIGRKACSHEPRRELRSHAIDYTSTTLRPFIASASIAENPGGSGKIVAILRRRLLTQAQVQHMRNHPMTGWYMHMGQTQFYPDSPTSIVALQNQLGLSGDQIKQLTSIQEKSNTDAKAVLTDEQRTKLATITKGWKPISMDRCWTLMIQ
jgi:hypothetical protein